MSRHSDTVDAINDQLRWCTSPRGHAVLAARAESLRTSDGRIIPGLGGDQVLEIVLTTLVDAEPVYWQPNLCEIVDVSALTLPHDWRLTSPHLFTLNGYVHFGKPMKPIPDHGKLGCGVGEVIRGFSWKKRDKSPFVDVVLYATPSIESISRVLTWETFQLVEPYVSDELKRQARRSIRKTGPIDLADIKEASPDFIRVTKLLAGELGIMRYGGIPWVVLPWRVGETIQTCYESITPRDMLDDPNTCQECDYFYFNVFASALNFLSTKVFVGHKQETDRTTLRRVEPKKHWNEVNVISLRRVERTVHPSDVEHDADFEYSCHFLVGSKDGGHWRNQYMPATRTHQYRWIGQYVKGDITKPFKPPSQRSFNVNR